MRMTGLDHALRDSSMTRSLSIWPTSSWMAFRQASGTLYGGTLTVTPGAVRISWWATDVLPGISENTPWCCITISSRSCFWAGLRSSPTGTTGISRRAANARGAGSGLSTPPLHYFRMLT